MSETPAVNTPGTMQPPTRAHLGIGERVGSGIVAAGMLGLLITAALLTPDGRGLGTHEQMGLPACDWPTSLGFPCATCGMTTAFTHLAHGDVAGSIAAQPMGAVLALACAVFVWPLGHSALTGSTWCRDVTGLLSPKTVIAGGLLWGGAWAYTIARWTMFTPSG